MATGNFNLTIFLWLNNTKFREDTARGDVRPSGQLKSSFTGIPFIAFRYDRGNAEHAQLNITDFIVKEQSHLLTQYFKSLAVVCEVLEIDTQDRRTTASLRV
jgi:hypothetical protein